MDNIEKLIPAEWSPLTWREQGIGDAAFRAGMRAAAEIVRQNPKEVALQVRPYEPISAENVSLLMDDAREACAALSLAILAEADK